MNSSQDTTELTVRDIVIYIIKNRRGPAFKGWNWKEITFRVCQAFENDEIALTFDSKGHINGLAIFKLDFEKKILYIAHILINEPGQFQIMCHQKIGDLTGWIIKAERNGKPVIYNSIQRFVRLLDQISKNNNHHAQLN